MPKLRIVPQLLALLAAPAAGSRFRVPGYGGDRSGAVFIGVGGRMPDNGLGGGYGSCAPCSTGPCCDPNAKPAQMCPGAIACCDCGQAACECPTATPAPPPPPPTPTPPAPPTPKPTPAPPTPPAPTPTPAPPSPPEPPACSACSSTSKACCNPKAQPPQTCPGGVECCDCGAAACECQAPTPAPPAGCSIRKDADISGFDFASASPGKGTTIQECCNICGATGGCAAVVLYLDVCYMKRAGGIVGPGEGREVATLYDPPDTPAPTPIPGTPPPVPVPPVDPQCATWYDSAHHNPNNGAFRNVKAFGAVGDGVTDDTKAIQEALSGGRLDIRSTKLPGVVYVPPGTYLVSGEIYLYFYTTLVGNSRCRPTIKLAANSAPKKYMNVISGPHSCDGCLHTDDFYYQLHHIHVDLTAGGNAKATGIHWPVSQGSSVRNVSVDATGAYAGFFGESGSGGFASDITITGGDYGIRTGSQQWTWRSITLKGQKKAAVMVFWNWFMTWLDVHISNTPVGVQTGVPGQDVGEQVGALLFLDSDFTDVGLAINATYAPGTTSNNTRRLLFDRTTFTRVKTITADLPGDASGAVTEQSWYQGPALESSKPLTGFRGKLPTVRPDAPLERRPRPSFGTGDGSSGVFNVLDAGAKGDGEADDTAAIQKAVNEHDQVFLPFGRYLISDTITLRDGNVLVGEVFTELMAKANATAFMDAANPKAMLSTPDDASATVQLADLMLMAGSDLPGCVLLQWRCGKASGLWDVHYRMMHGVHTLTHVTGNGAGYFENSWGWVADHDMDTGVSVNVTNPRGMLVESQGPLWLYGTAYEHSSMYQYHFNGAANVVNLVFQTESPYWQSPPTAFGVQITNSHDILSYGSGLYNWFNGEQASVLSVTSSTKVNMYGHNTHGVTNLLAGDTTIPAKGPPYNVTSEFCENFVADVPL